VVEGCGLMILKLRYWVVRVKIRCVGFIGLELEWWRAIWVRNWSIGG